MAAIGHIPTKQDFQVFKGDTWAPGTIYIKENDVAVNITGWTAKMEIRTLNGVLVETLSSAGGELTIAGVAGTITPVLSATRTNAMLPGEYKYDLQFTKTNGHILTVIYGLFTVSGDTTVNT